MKKGLLPCVETTHAPRGFESAAWRNETNFVKKQPDSTDLGVFAPAMQRIRLLPLQREQTSACPAFHEGTRFFFSANELLKKTMNPRIVNLRNVLPRGHARQGVFLVKLVNEPGCEALNKLSTKCNVSLNNFER